MKEEKTLSIFIDESGDFGKVDNKFPFYHVALILHEQSNDISDSIHKLENKLSNWGYESHYIHVGPLIRKEKPYEEDLREKRKSFFNLLFQFAQHCPIQYIMLTMNKSKCDEYSKVGYTKQLSKLLAKALRENEEYFRKFDKVNVYYDYGQSELAIILTTTFTFFFDDVEIRKSLPVDYRLLQVADLICTVEMMENKSTFTQSEIDFFWSRRDFKKNVLKTIRKKMKSLITYP